MKKKLTNKQAYYLTLDEKRQLIINLIDKLNDIPLIYKHELKEAAMLLTDKEIQECYESMTGEHD